MLKHKLHSPSLLRSLVIACVCGFATVHSVEPNPPQWPNSVSVFQPSDPSTTIQAKVDAVYSENGGRKNNGQFSSSRFALLFAPGNYTVEVPVGFYTQVIGLGRSPTDVVFNSSKGVYCEEGDYAFDTGALDTFWRGAENFETHASYNWGPEKGMLWAVSQAAPLRRLVISNGLMLAQAVGGPDGYASGGYLADSIVRGNVTSGSQQQWITRTSTISGWNDGSWNMVFVGVEGAPADHCANVDGRPYVVVDRAPLTAGKPFISISTTTGKYALNIPAARRDGSGADVSQGGQNWTPAPSVDFSSVYVATVANDTAKTINAKLQAGLHVVLTPGIYRLDAPLVVVTNNQVLLGIGFATIIPVNGTAAVKVLESVTGARVGGLLLQAGTSNSETLLMWGNASDGSSRALPRADNDYGFIHDLFTRVGGANTSNGRQARATTMVQIDSSFVIADNLWLWRADHGEVGNFYNGDNPCDHALVVNGDDVTTYGLAGEHTLKEIVIWNGERGATYFFQAELPYDVQSYPYAGYTVAAGVKAHASYGAGVYHFFRDYNVTVESGIAVPSAVESSFISPLGVHLSGKGIMNHIINDKGNVTSTASPSMVAWVCAYPTLTTLAPTQSNPSSTAPTASHRPSPSSIVAPLIGVGVGVIVIGVSVFVFIRFKSSCRNVRSQAAYANMHMDQTDSDSVQQSDVQQSDDDIHVFDTMDSATQSAA